MSPAYCGERKSDGDGRTDVESMREIAFSPSACHPLNILHRGGVEE